MFGIYTSIASAKRMWSLTSIVPVHILYLKIIGEKVAIFLNKAIMAPHLQEVPESISTNTILWCWENSCPEDGG